MLASGERLHAKAVIIATEAPVARRLLDDHYPSDGRSVTCLYFAADAAPIKEPILVLNGEGKGPINNLCVPSQVSPSYAPAGRSLVSVTVLGTHADQAALQDQVVAQLQKKDAQRAVGRALKITRRYLPCRAQARRSASRRSPLARRHPR